MWTLDHYRNCICQLQVASYVVGCVCVCEYNKMQSSDNNPKSMFTLLLPIINTFRCNVHSIALFLLHFLVCNFFGTFSFFFFSLDHIALQSFLCVCGEGEKYFINERVYTQPHSRIIIITITYMSLFVINYD